MALPVPMERLDEFNGLPEKIQAEINSLVSLFRRVDDSGNLTGTVREFARERAGQKGMSKASLIRKYYKWVQADRDGLALVSKSKLKRGKSALPKATIEYYRELCLENQRVCRQAYFRLCREWREGLPIPGYGTWRQWWMRYHGGELPDICPGLPKGWSERTFARHAPPKVELVAARKGRTAARSFSPLVFTTRKNLEVGQYYVFDDVWHDILVNFIGVNKKAMRPLELACLDLFSGSKFAYGIKPMTEEDGKRVQLKEREMRFLLAAVLVNHGYRQDGTTLVVEHGTAAIREDLEQYLHDATGGAISVDRSGIDGAAAFAGAYCGQPKGNFRIKAALESQHSLMHNATAHLPGQTGSNSRVNAPEELYGRERHNNQLIRAMAALPPERAELLLHPFLHFEQFMQIIGEIYDAIDSRIQHDLEGWEEAGLVVSEFRLDSAHPWVPAKSLLALQPERRAAVEAIISQPGMSRIRKASPREVWRSRSGSLIKLPASCIPKIIGRDFIVERTVGEDGLITFKDREMGPGKFRYLGKMKNASGEITALTGGETVATIVNPFDPERLIICGSYGEYRGWCPRWESISRDDTDALHEAMGRSARELNERLQPMARAGASRTQERTDRNRHNLKVISGKPITEHERAIARRVQNEKGDLDDLLEPAAVPAKSDHDVSEEDFDSLL